MPAFVDLSHRIEPDMSVYPGDRAVKRVAHATHANNGYRAETLSLSSHTGTHIDAPLHTERGGNSLGDYPLDRFVFECVRVDCRDLDAREPITPDRLPRDATADSDMVVLWTGWDIHWKTDRYADHPFVAPETAAALADRGLAVGLDAFSPDPTPSPTAAGDANDDTGEATADDTADIDEATADNIAETGDDPLAAHHALLGSDCLVVENLTNLAGVGDRFELRAYPLALGGDGAPVRAVGVDTDR